MEQHVVSGIAYSRDEAKISLRKVKDKPGVSAGVFGPLAEADISVDMIVQNVSEDGAVADITFTLPRKDLRKAIELLEKLKAQVGATGGGVVLRQANRDNLHQRCQVIYLPSRARSA